jgi:hypothetical protein
MYRYQIIDSFGHIWNIKIFEKSRIAKIASKKFHNSETYITIGNNIYLTGEVNSFLECEWCIYHEIGHIQQYQKLGYQEFYKRYLFLFFLYGYRNHPMERNL